MCLRYAEPVDDAQQIGNEIVERERPIVVVARAVASRIPGNSFEVRGERRQLRAPVGAIAADAVQKDEQRPSPCTSTARCGCGGMRSVG
jgi:hypothetical protein